MAKKQNSDEKSEGNKDKILTPRYDAMNDDELLKTTESMHQTYHTPDNKPGYSAVKKELAPKIINSLDSKPVRIDVNIETLTKIQSRLNDIKDQVQDYLTNVLGPKTILEEVKKYEEREVLEEAGLKNLYGLVWNFRPREKEVKKYEIVESIPKQIKGDYSFDALEKLISEGLNQVEEGNKELTGLQTKLEESVKHLTNISMKYNHDLVKANVNYVESQKNSTKYNEISNELSNRINQKLGTDEKKAEFQDKYLEAKLDLSAALNNEIMYAEDAKMTDNFRERVNILIGVLTDFQLETKLWGNYFEKGIEGGRHINITLENAYKAGNYLVSLANSIQSCMHHLTFGAQVTYGIYDIMKQGLQRSSNDGNENFDQLKEAIDCKKINAQNQRIEYTKEMEPLIGHQTTTQDILTKANEASKTYQPKDKKL